MAVADDLDVPGGRRDHRAVHRVDLHALGGSSRSHSLRHHPYRLVLAEERRGGWSGGGRHGSGAGPAMKQTSVVDVSDLPSYAFGHRSVLWWGSLGFVITEATAFALAVTGYFYLRHISPTWPPTGPPPLLIWGTVNLVI